MMQVGQRVVVNSHMHYQNDRAGSIVSIEDRKDKPEALLFINVRLDDPRPVTELMTPIPKDNVFPFYYSELRLE